MEEKTLDRGLQACVWYDRTGNACSLQQSNLDDRCTSENGRGRFLWLGPTGTDTHDRVALRARMLIDRETAAELVERLGCWLDTDSIFLPADGDPCEESTRQLACGYDLMPAEDPFYPNEFDGPQ